MLGCEGTAPCFGHGSVSHRTLVRWTRSKLCCETSLCSSLPYGSNPPPSLRIPPSAAFLRAAFPIRGIPAQASESASMSTRLRFRQIHLDFHTSPLIPDVGRDFDENAFAETFRFAHCDS